MNITVLGCGRWGSFITWYLSTRGFSVTEWGRPGSPSLAELRDTHRNEYVALPDGVCLTDDLAAAVGAADVLAISIRSSGLRELSRQMAAVGAREKPILLCMKGLEEGSGLRLSEILLEEGYAREKICIWVGPGHIQEFTAGHPNCMVIDGYDAALSHHLADTFRSPLIRFYYGDDMIGNEVGAAAKNVMGLAAGMLDGCGFSSLKGPLMARGAREVARLIGAMGGREQSAYGLCHLGDYETTLFSPYSHNRRYGEALVRGEPFHRTAEGVGTAAALCVLERRYGVELPITRAVYRVIYEGADPRAELPALFARRAVTEFWT